MIQTTYYQKMIWFGTLDAENITGDRFDQLNKKHIFPPKDMFQTNVIPGSVTIESLKESCLMFMNYSQKWMAEDDFQVLDFQFQNAVKSSYTYFSDIFNNKFHMPQVVSQFKHYIKVLHTDVCDHIVWKFENSLSESTPKDDLTYQNKWIRNQIILYNKHRDVLRQYENDYLNL